MLATCEFYLHTERVGKPLILGGDEQSPLCAGALSVSTDDQHWLHGRVVPACSLLKEE